LQKIYPNSKYSYFHNLELSAMERYNLMSNKFDGLQAGRNLVTSSTRIFGLTRLFGRNRITLGACALVCAALLSACSISTIAATPTSTPTPTSIPTVANMSLTTNTTDTPSAPSLPSAPSGPQQTLVPTSLDPCQLVTSQVASALAGATYGPGKEDTTPGGGRICWYGYQTLNVFMVLVGQEKDAATAQADKAQFQAVLEAKMPEMAGAGITVTEVPNFADGAATAQGSINLFGKTIHGSDFGFVKGAIFIGLADITSGNAATSSAALQAEATTLLGQLP
jgi:hypothetical protein